MAKQTAVLRIYKGKEVLMKADGVTPANENQDVTLTYNDTQWKNHLTNLKRLGVCKIEVREFYEGETKTEIPKELKDEIDSLLKVNVKELTPEQKAIKELQEKNEASEKRNAELQTKLESFMSGNANGIEVIKPVLLETKEEEFKSKVDLLIENGFERIEDNFTKEDSVYSVEKVYEIKLEDLQNELNPLANENSDLLEAQSKYLAKFGKEVSNRYKNNLAWILTELEK